MLILSQNSLTGIINFSYWTNTFLYVLGSAELIYPAAPRLSSETQSADNAQKQQETGQLKSA